MGSEYRIDRRKFFSVAGAIGLFIVDSTLKHLPSSQARSQEIPAKPNSFLEDGLGEFPSLLDSEEGHAKFMKHYLNSPLVRRCLKTHLYRIINTDPVEPEIKLGSDFNNHLTVAKEHQELNYNDLPDQTTLKLAVITFALANSPYLSLNEVEALGVTIDESRHFELKDCKSNFKERSYLVLSRARANLAKTFPGDPKYCTPGADTVARCDGFDRTVHLAQHLALTYFYTSFHLEGRSNMLKLPAFLETYLSLRSGDIFKRAQALSELASQFWEGKETLHGLKGIFDIVQGTANFALFFLNLLTDESKLGTYTPPPKESLKKRVLSAVCGDSGIELGQYNPTVEGNLDPFVKSDVLANKAGSRFAVLIAQIFEPKDLTDLLMDMNAPEFRMLTEPGAPGLRFSLN